MAAEFENEAKRQAEEAIKAGAEAAEAAAKAAEEVAAKAAEEAAKAEAEKKAAEEAAQAAEEAAAAAKEAAQDAAEKVQEAVGGDETDETSAEAEVKPNRALKEFDVDWEAEKICRWGAARAGAIAVVPFLGSMALIANEVYMIVRLADLRGVHLSEGTAVGLLGSLGATFAGQTLATILPLPFLTVPIAISVTYGVGKAVNKWLKAGRPEDVASFKEAFEEARKEGMDKVDELKENPDKDKPLGDEKKKFDVNAWKAKFQKVKQEDLQKKVDELKKMRPEDVSAKAEELFYTVTGKVDRAEGSIGNKFEDIRGKVGPARRTGQRWCSVQHWEQLRHGQLVIPYSEIHTYLVQAMAGSDFSLLDIGFGDPDRLKLQLQHKKYGTLALDLTIQDFVVNQQEAYTHIKIESFDITDNAFASLVLQVVGDKLILAILGVIFDNTEIKTSGVKTVYSDSVVSVDFHDLLEQQEFSKKQFLRRRPLEILNLVSLKPAFDGLKLGAKLKFKKDAPKGDAPDGEEKADDAPKDEEKKTDEKPPMS